MWVCSDCAVSFCLDWSEGSVVVVMGNVEVEVDGGEHIICGMSLMDNGIVG